MHCNEKFQDPLSLLRRLIASFHHVRGWEERLCACLHSAAAEGFGRFDSEQRRQADMSRQLLHFLGQLAAAGHFQLPANQHSVQSALSGAAKLGQLHELQLLASQVPDGLATPELARDIMLGALSSGLLCVVRQAAAASAAPAEPPSSPLDRLLGPHFASLVPGMMEEMVRTAKEHQRPQLVQLLLASGFPITHGVVLLCVSSLDAPTLEAGVCRLPG